MILFYSIGNEYLKYLQLTLINAQDSEEEGKMGTVYNQSPRESFNIKMKDVEDLLEEAQTISIEKGIPISDCLEAYRILEFRRKNDLYHRNGDTFDEQVAGIARILEEKK